MIEFLRGDVITGKGELLVFGILVIILIGEIGETLVFYHLTHQFHGRVVLTTITLSLGAYRHVLQHLGIRLQLDINDHRSPVGDGDGL